MQEDKECSFRPEIDKVSDIIVAAKKCLRPSEEDLVSRLCTQDALQQQHYRQHIEEEHYKQFTFTPAINPLSSHIIEACTLILCSLPLQSLCRLRSLMQQLRSELAMRPILIFVEIQ